MSRSITFVLLGMMLMTATFAALPSQAAPSGIGAFEVDAGRPVVYEVDGMRYHLMTEQEMLSIREKIGVRQAGADYNIVIDGHGTGLAPPTDQEWLEMVGKQKVFEQEQLPPPSLPMSYDISTQSYFPKVGNQGGQGSCAAWAATYYCYGYLEAKDNDWTDAKAGTNQSHLMSPAWTFNRVNSGGTAGSWMSGNFQVIIDWGVPSLATMPYNDGDPIGWGGPAAYREAPLHRAASYTTDYFINGNAAINEIKSWVSSSIPVSFAFDANQYYNGNLNDNILTAAEYQSGTYNHANTFVGYDNNVSVGVEHGAFKVVNSWGAGFGAGGYYWLTYDAVKEIANSSYLWLTTVTDKQDYSPSILGVWHFNSAPSRTCSIQLGIGSHSSPSSTRTASFDYDADKNLSTFMCLDISEFKPYFDSGVSNIWVEMRNGGAGTMSSFRVETYSSNYVMGGSSTASGQSPDVPKTMPGYATVDFAKYDFISIKQALEADTLSFSSGGQAKWVGVNHQSYYDGDSMQSGDVSDSAYSYLQTTVSGTTGISFYWKVSSETSKDLLRFYVDGSQKASISGQVDWQKVNFTLLPGTHVLRWNYTRDSANCGNKDMAWVDKVMILPSDDVYEENDNQGQASTLSPSGTYNGLVGLDDDWYGLHVEVDDKLTVRLDLNATLGDLDLYLYGTDGTTLIDSSVTSGSYEVVELLALVGGNYLLKVQPDSGQFSTYSLTLTYETGALDYGKNSSLAISSGTGGFASIMPSKSVSAVAGSTLSGTIVLHANVTWLASEQVPLIGTNNWGSPSSSFFGAVPDLAAGITDVEVAVSTTVPATPGTYYLIFAFRNESSAGHVASATDDAVGAPVWDDGNDLASLSIVQINESREVGRTLGNWLRIDGMRSVRIPSDALLINVVPPDTTPPETSSSLSGTSGSSGWYRSSVTVTMTATDSGSGVASTYCRVGGGAWTEYLAPFSVTGQGTFNIDYYSIDNQGNAEAPKGASIKIDVTSPSTTLDLSGTSGGNDWFISEVGLSISASDALSGVQSSFYRVDGGTWLRYLPGASIAVEGPHQVDYYSTDVAGNSESTKRMSVPIDRSAPSSAAVLEGVEGNEGWYLGQVSVSLVAGDSFSGMALQSYSYDGGEWQEYLAPFNVTSPGQHRVEFNSSDLAGNAEGTQAITFSIDPEPPISSADVRGTLGQEGWYVSSVDVEINASDALSGLFGIQYSLDGGPWENYTSILTISASGEHTLLYRAEDIAGNVQSEVELELLVDISLPTSELKQIGTAGDDGWFVSMVEFEPNGSDVGSGIASYHFRVDGGAWSILAGNASLGEDGEHVIEVYAVDKAGNVGPIMTRLVKIDLGAPSSSLTAIGSEGNEGWFVSSVDLELQASDPVSGVDSIYYSISGGAWASYSGRITIDVEGVYEVSFYATDHAGNVEDLSSMEVMIELSLPISSLSLQGSEGKAGWYVSAVIGDLSATDPLSGVAQTLYRLDGSDWHELQGQIEIGQGQHALDYYSVDVAGNMEPVRSSDVWVDILSPTTVNSTQGEAGMGGWFVSQVAVSLSPYDDGSGLDRTLYQVDGGPWMNYSIPFTLSEEGVHTVRYFSTDLAGNEAQPINMTVMMDLVAPTTSVELEGVHGSNDWFVSIVNFTMSEHDGMSGSLETVWRLDGGAWTTYDGLSSVGSMGIHTLEYRTQDRAGNWEEARQEAFRIDLERPTLKLNSTGKPFTSKDVSLRFDAGDAGSNVSMITVRVDGEPSRTLSQGPWAFEVDSLSDGWHDLEVTVYDEAGNSLNQTVRFKVDTNPLSPEGPYGPWLLLGIAALAIATLLIVVLLRKKGK